MPRIKRKPATKKSPTEQRWDRAARKVREAKSKARQAEWEKGEAAKKQRADRLRKALRNNPYKRKKK